MADGVRGTDNIYTGTCEFNALEFLMRSATNNLATAIPVKVVTAYGGGSGAAAGYVDVLPLVTFVDGNGETVQPVTLYHLPYSRVQGGIAAVVIDACAGDIGLAVFAHSDSSNVVAGTDSPQQPASMRHHSQSDGFYIGGFLNQAPECYLELTQDNTAVLRAVNGVRIIGDTTIDGNVTVNGYVAATGDVTAGNISLQTHIHGGVETGGGTTSKPQ